MRREECYYSHRYTEQGIKTMLKQEKKYYRNAFLIAFIMGLVLLLPFVVIDGGYFVYYGDYNAQQIPFYKTCIEAVHDGNFGWNWQTDLGVNFVGSYSFYTLGSPFFWLAALFPASVSQYLMAPLLALKLGLCSLFAFMYVRRFVTKPQSAVIAGILYAFSGFSLYNIFFNHFHEAMVFFPLLLIGLEEAVVNKRRVVFALAVALNAFVNYFFFIGECVFLVIYFVARLCMSKDFRIKAGDFFCLGFESIAGVMLAGILFVPSIYQVLDVPRSTNILSDTNFLFYGYEQRYGLILEGIFFPPEVPARSLMFTEANAKWSSVALYLPLFSMAGVIAFVKDAKGHWARAVLPVCLAMALVPGLNALFVLLNNNFYTRWFYMPELICCFATVYTLERRECDLKFGLKSCAVVAGAIAAVVMLHPTTQEYEITAADGTVEKADRILPNFLNDMSPVLYIQFAVAAGMLVVLGFLIRMHKKSTTTEFLNKACAATIACSMMLGYYFVGYGRILGPYIGDYNKTVSADIRIEDASFYRIESFGEIKNANMLWDQSGLLSFTSIIPSSTFELYDLLSIKRDVNSDPEHDRYALRSLTNTKYFIVRADHDEEEKQEALDSLTTFTYRETQGDYEIYENNYALPMGYSYDSYILLEDAKKKGAADKLMMRSVVLTEEQAEKYSDILTLIPEDEENVTTYERFVEDAEDRIASGIIQFNVNNTGFTAMTNYESDELVVFSVPFDKGWSAAVGGTSVDVEKVNGGFVAIRVPQGIQEIRFTYTTPGIKLGIIMTIVAAVLLMAYFVVWWFVLRRRPKSFAHLYQYDQIEGVKAHKAYISQLSKQIYNCPEKGRTNVAEEEALQWPDVEEEFMDMSRYDFDSIQPKERTSHITEDDEAYRVMQELDSKNNDEIE